jgi:cell division protein FtsZ
MGIGVASGENRAGEAARQAVSSPLLEASIEGATGILLNVTGGPDMGLFEVNEAAEVVTGAADQNANVIFGAVIDQGLKDEVADGDRHRLRARALPPPSPRAASCGEEGTGERVRLRATKAPSRCRTDVLEVPSFLRDR